MPVCPSGTGKRVHFTVYRSRDVRLVNGYGTGVPRVACRQFPKQVGGAVGFLPLVEMTGSLHGCHLDHRKRSLATEELTNTFLRTLPPAPNLAFGIVEGGIQRSQGPQNTIILRISSDTTQQPYRVPASQSSAVDSR